MQQYWATQSHCDGPDGRKNPDSSEPNLVQFHRTDDEDEKYSYNIQQILYSIQVTDDQSRNTLMLFQSFAVTDNTSLPLEQRGRNIWMHL